jgi:homoserine O-acetyltransferase
MKSQQVFRYDQPFALEAGGVLPGFDLQYTTLGKPNASRSNVVWVIHALTGNSDVTSWWPGLFEAGGPFDPSEYYVICANTLGGCYGSTGPLSLNPTTDQPFYHSFPAITNRDIAAAFDHLRVALGLLEIDTVIGSSLGGQQALEWTLLAPSVFKNLILIATNARHSPWGIAFNEAQRMAIAADSSWQENSPSAGKQGMKAARAIGMLSYRSAEGFGVRQLEESDAKLDDYRAASYQRYQGEKLADRFNAYTYWILSKAMDSHHVGRGRGAVEQVLSQVRPKTLVVGIETDLLFQISEQRFLAEHIPGATLSCLQSQYGHDGFLVEFDQLCNIIQNFYKTIRSEVQL